MRFNIKIEEVENVATIAELAATVLDYERVLRRIERWGRDHEPRIWAREILESNQRRLDS